MLSAFPENLGRGHKRSRCSDLCGKIEISGALLIERSRAFEGCLM